MKVPHRLVLNEKKKLFRGKSYAAVPLIGSLAHAVVAYYTASIEVCSLHRSVPSCCYRLRTRKSFSYPMMMETLVETVNLEECSTILAPWTEQVWVSTHTGEHLP